MRRPHSANTRFNQHQQPRLAQTTMYMAGSGNRLRDRSRAGSRTDSRGSSTGRVAVNNITGTVNVIVGPSRSVSPGPNRNSSRAPSRNSEGPRRSSAFRAPSPHTSNQIWSQNCWSSSKSGEQEVLVPKGHKDSSCHLTLEELARSARCLHQW